MRKNKLLLIGWDAADWDIIAPLISKGQMPALKKIIDNGVYGNMGTMNPPYSPMLWTSVVTGKTPDKHGVLGFVEIMPNMDGVRQVTTNSRKSRAIWNILHNRGLKSNLVGWWPSYPAEPINGVVISDKFQKVDPNPKKQKPLEKNAIHPEEVYEDFVDLRMFPHEITKEHILPFIPKAQEIDQSENSDNNGLLSFSRVMAHNVSVHNAVTKLLRTSEWDLTCVYYDLIDHICHNFMKYHPPRLSVIPESMYDLYKDVVVGAYRFQDMMLQRKLDLIDDDTTVIVMSDHGFESGNKRILKMPKVQAAPALEHRQFGMFAAMGPNIKKNQKVFGMSLMDVAPTILHHFDFPIGKDMDGKVMFDIFKKSKQPVYIDSWENVKGDFGELKKDDESSSVMSDQETMEQLIELGYIERPDENKNVAVLKTKCDLKHNLAQVYIGKKEYTIAKELLEELIQEEDTIDKAPYYMELFNIYIKEENYEEADKYLNKTKETKTEIKYNFLFPETEILIGKGKLYEALRLLEQASLVRTNSSEIWYRIGEINYKLLKFENARKALANAIKIEPDKAKYHRTIAEIYIELGEYEEAVDYALTSIELVKYFPAAHYILGRALEKMGDYDNAKVAYETAERLQPRVHEKARKAIENIEERNILENDDYHGNYIYKYKENQIVVVSGLPRSGTSLMMQMLAKGGIDILTDENRKADVSNPKGYYEYDPVMSIHKDNSWLGEAQNKAIKIVAPLLRYLSSQYRYKIIFMVRDLNEVVKSQQVMLGKDPNVLPIKLFDSYKDLIEKVKVWKEREPGVEMIYVNYKDALEIPEVIVDKVVDFIGKDNIDKQAMISCVDKKLYRNRTNNSTS